jgi:hypothetical protein
VHLPVVIDSHYPDDPLGLAVPGDQHRPRAGAGGITGFAQRGPAESLIVFVVESRLSGRYASSPGSSATSPTVSRLNRSKRTSGTC